MLDYKSSAEQILDLVGGKTNITQFAHCSTRLRFTLKDNSKANLDALKKVPGVVGVVLKGQLQVIIGNNVVEMYEALQKAGQLEGAGIVPDDDAPAPKKKVSDLVLDFLIGTFQPLIGVITGGGLIKTLLTLLTMAGWMDKSSDLYQVMFNIADATFYFLPVMIAYTSATKLCGSLNMAVHPYTPEWAYTEKYLYLPASLSFTSCFFTRFSCSINAKYAGFSLYIASKRSISFRNASKSS